PGKVIHWRLDGTPAPTPCDARLLEMILRNLLGNAFAFSPSPGEIRVAWDLDGERWRLLVADRGPGIDPDELPHIFTPFYKGRTGRRDSAPRNGIGLAIVAEDVRMQEGRSTVQAPWGEGACFCCEFPCRPLEDIHWTPCRTPSRACCRRAASRSRRAPWRMPQPALGDPPLTPTTPCWPGS